MSLLLPLTFDLCINLSRHQKELLLDILRNRIPMGVRQRTKSGIQEYGIAVHSPPLHPLIKLGKWDRPEITKRLDAEWPQPLSALGPKVQQILDWGAIRLHDNTSGIDA